MAEPPITTPPRPVRIRRHTLVDGDAARLGPSDERVGESYPRVDLRGRDLTGVSFRECAFVGPTLTDTLLVEAQFIDCRLTESFALTLPAARSIWRRVLVQRPRWGSAELYDSDLTTVHIRDGKVDYLNVRESRLIDVLIEDCVITNLDLGSCRATRLAISRCRIGTLDVGNTVFEDVDLRSSEFGVINGLEGLKGATVDESQLMELAPLLARHIGVRVG